MPAQEQTSKADVDRKLETLSVFFSGSTSSVNNKYNGTYLEASVVCPAWERYALCDASAEASGCCDGAGGCEEFGGDCVPTNDGGLEYYQMGDLI